jgi:hypothetical protein
MSSLAASMRLLNGFFFRNSEKRRKLAMAVMAMMYSKPFILVVKSKSVCMFRLLAWI